MLEKGRRSDNSQFIHTKWRKNTLPLPTSEPQIFSKKYQRCLRALHVQILKRMGKSLPGLCAPKAKLSTLKYWFLVRVSPIFEKTERMKKSVQLTHKIVQLHESGTVFQPRRISSYAILHRLSRIGKQYANMLEEYDTWSQVFNQTFEVRATNVCLLD